MAQDDTFVISPPTALAMGENLLALLNTIMQSLPESELHEMRDALDRSVAFADDLLHNISISSTFDMLTINDVSAIHNVNGSTRASANSHSPGGVTTIAHKTSIPPSSPVSTADANTLVLRSPSLTLREVIASSSTVIAHDETPAPEYVAVEHDRSATPGNGLIISTRPRVGRPNYTNHPAFIEPGIPGPYSRPPVDSSNPDLPAYYVVTKGLYVGIFCSWNECAPWVVKVPGSIYCKVKCWAEAQCLYNTRLGAGACEVLK